MRLQNGLLMAALAAALGVSPIALGQSVTITTKAAPLGSVLAEASKQTGLKLDAGSLRSWPVIVSVKDMSGKEFLEGIAKVCDAEWERSGETYQLVRGVSRSRMAENAEAERRLPWIESEVAKYLRENASAEDWSPDALDKRIKEDAERRANMAGKIQVAGGGQGGEMKITMVDSATVSAAAIVLHEAMRKIPAKQLASILPGRRIVYATNTTRMQRQLPYVPTTIDDFVKVYNRLLAAQRSVPDQPAGGLRIESRYGSQKQPISGIGKLILGVQRMSGGLHLALTVVGSEGQILDNAQAYLNPPAEKAGEAPAGAVGEVPFSAPSITLLRAFQKASPAGDRVRFTVAFGDLTGSLMEEDSTRLSPELAAILSNPAANEPHSYFVSDALLGLAANRKKNLIAHAPDPSFGRFAQRFNTGKASIPDLYRSAPQLGIAIDESEGMIFVRADVQAEADRGRVNRAEFSKLVSAVASRAYASLDELSRYSLAMPTWDERNLDALWLGAFSPATHGRYSPDQIRFMKLYATLTPFQRQQNENRMLILLNQMSPQQKGMLEDIVFGRGGGPVIIGRGLMTMVTSVQGVPGQRGNQRPEPEIVQQEPTEAFPNGLPANTRLILTRRWEEGVYAIDENGVGRFLSAGDLGLRQGMDVSQFPPAMRPKTKFDKYQLADLLNVTLNLDFGRTNESGTLRDASIRRGASAVAFEALPQGFRENVQRARERAANMRGMTIGNTKPVRPPL